MRTWGSGSCLGVKFTAGVMGQCSRALSPSVDPASLLLEAPRRGSAWAGSCDRPVNRPLGHSGAGASLRTTSLDSLSACADGSWCVWRRWSGLGRRWRDGEQQGAGRSYQASALTPLPCEAFALSVP